MKAASPTAVMDTLTDLKHSMIEIALVSLRDLVIGLDWLEKTHIRLAPGEREKESS